jgi:tRNA dimethylallyltransferase
MLDAGLVAEARALADRPGGLSRTARRAIGYQEMFEHVAGIEPSLAAATERAVARTRRFARRQRVWFRRDPRVRWLDATGNPGDLFTAALACWRAPAPTAP